MVINKMCIHIFILLHVNDKGFLILVIETIFGNYEHLNCDNLQYTEDKVKRIVPVSHS